MGRGKDPTQYNEYIQAIVNDLQIDEVHIHWHAKLKKNFAGFANAKGHVWLHKNLKSAFEFADENHYQYQVLRIIAHELRHRWQFQNGKLAVEKNDKEVIWKWDGVVMPCTHISKEGVPEGYDLQPWESDANEYARIAINKFSHLVKEYT
jgi:hypothetical protein